MITNSNIIDKFVIYERIMPVEMHSHGDLFHLKTSFTNGFIITSNASEYLSMHYLLLLFDIFRYPHSRLKFGHRTSQILFNVRRHDFGRTGEGRRV